MYKKLLLVTAALGILSCVPPQGTVTPPVRTGSVPTTTTAKNDSLTVVAGRKSIVTAAGLDVTPTPWFCAIYCANPRIDSIVSNSDIKVLLKVDDTIKAYDPQGVECGIGVMTNNAGGNKVILKFTPIYGDDYTTPNVDEGAKDGDTITFKIVHNDMLGTPLYRTYECISIPPLVWKYQDIVERCAFRITSCCTKRGDIDGDNNIDISDLTILLNFLFVNPGEGITCLGAADFDADGSVDIADVTDMVAYLFQDGPPPSNIPCK